MDKLDRAIARTEKEIDELKRRAEQLELELRGLKRAATLRPSGEGDVNNEEGEDPLSKRGGRQKGAISRTWRAVLARMYAGGINAPMRLEDIVHFAQSLGLSLHENSALARMRHYCDVGFVEEDARGLFRVTQAAAERFGLKDQDPG